MKITDFAKQVLLPSIASTIVAMALWHNFPIKGRILSWEEIPVAASIMFGINLVGWGWNYIKKHL